MKLIIVGSSGHAAVIAEAATLDHNCEVIGISTKGEIHPLLTQFRKLQTDSEIRQIVSDNPGCMFFVAIGDNYTRLKVGMEWILKWGIEAAIVVHPSAQVSASARVSPGSAILAGSHIGPNCVIGKFCLLNTLCSIDHDSIMDLGSSLAPGAILGGNVHLKHCSAVSMGATLKQGVEIGKNTVIGAGSVVLNSIDADSIAYGVPAKIVRKREPDEAYLK